MILGASDVTSHVEECRPAVAAPAVGAAIYRWNFPGPRFTTRIICLILSVDLAEVEPVTSSDFRGSGGSRMAFHRGFFQRLWSQCGGFRVTTC